MLNGAFLPNHSNYGFDFIFTNLKYVVIDELHSYRGAFGSHLANIFRRLQRVCRYYQAAPQFLCSSATIANPVELDVYKRQDQEGFTSGNMFEMVKKMKLRDALSYGNVPEDVMNRLNEQLGKIPNI